MNEDEDEDEDEGCSEEDDDVDSAPEDSISIDHNDDSQSMPDDYARFCMLDFNPERISSLLALSDIERATLSHELQVAARDGTSKEPFSTLALRSPRPLVEIITRHYTYGPEETEEDLEYSMEAFTPEPWTSHLRQQRRERARARARASSQIRSAGLVYDERPTNRRERVLSVGSAHVKIKLLLPASGRNDLLALADSGVLQVPELGEGGKAGRMYFYN
jgi:hypothetical protein